MPCLYITMVLLYISLYIVVAKLGSLSATRDRRTLDHAQLRPVELGGD